MKPTVWYGATAPLVFVVACQAQQLGAPFTIERLGLFDSEHTGAPGGLQQQSQLSAEAGPFALGVSTRYLRGSSNGQSAWLWSHELGNIRVGLFDAEHSNGTFQNSFASSVNSSGRASGTSERFGGGSFLGRTAWVADASGTTAIGYVDEVHTSLTGLRTSDAGRVTPTGQVIGSSERYRSGGGRTGWIWDSALGLTRLGLSDAEHTRADGAQITDVMGINDSLLAIGQSARYSGAAAAGTSAWAWTRDAGTNRIGFTDAQHTRADGFQFSSPGGGVGPTGLVSGQSSRFSGASQTGNSAWAWTQAGGTVRIGLTGPDFTDANGAQDSSPSIVGNSHVAGTSFKFQSGGGTAAWSWTAPLGTRRIGLVDAQHTSTIGRQNSNIERMNPEGAVVGRSARYTGDFERGTSAWLFTDAAGTVDIGLNDAIHTSANGTRQSFPIALNAASQVIGTATRYQAGSNSTLGDSGWFYDPASGVTTTLDFSIAANGFASTRPSLITQSGWVLGTYSSFDGAAGLGDHAFLWSLSRGFSDLGSLVGGGLDASGWRVLTSVVSADDVNFIAGEGGRLTNQGTAIYAIIPSPAAGAVLLAPLFLARRRR